jgi:tetratricopeptide (TPR) repeat protein
MSPMMRTVLGFVAAGMLAASVWAQEAADIQRLFEAGRDQQVVDGVRTGTEPAVVYLAAQSYERLGNPARALELYQTLSRRSATDAWRFIGLSARALLENRRADAVTAARQAVGLAANLAAAHYQLGITLSGVQNWSGAAEAFDRASLLNPTLAYAHYYRGFALYETGRYDLAAAAFVRFLTLAPRAPERADVQQILDMLD